MRAVNELAEEERAAAEDEEKQQAVTFSQFWDSTYLPDLQTTKSIGSIESEIGMFKKWIEPVVGKIPMQDLAPVHVEKIVSNARSAKKSAATIRYIITVISQLWTTASLHEIVTGECPCKKVKKPHEDNRRMRFLTQDEAKLLLDDLALHSKDMHDIALLSLSTGLRAGEIHALTWGNIDFKHDVIEVIDTKNKTNRHAYMTNEVKQMILSRYKNQNKNDLLFPGRLGQKRRWVGSSFDRAVRRLGLNDTGEVITHFNGEREAVQITDRRKKVVFHTLRHTFASWLVQAGTPLYTVAGLMGHSTIEMTQRYSHLAPDSLRIAAMRIGEIFQADPCDEG